jgi:hypothetical protein
VAFRRLAWRLVLATWAKAWYLREATESRCLRFLTGSLVMDGWCSRWGTKGERSSVDGLKGVSAFLRRHCWLSLPCFYKPTRPCISASPSTLSNYQRVLHGLVVYRTWKRNSIPIFDRGLVESVRAGMCSRSMPAPITKRSYQDVASPANAFKQTNMNAGYEQSSAPNGES